jgi:hypothetical protein
VEGRDENGQFYLLNPKTQQIVWRSKPIRFTPLTEDSVNNMSAKDVMERFKNNAKQDVLQRRDVLDRVLQESRMLEKRLGSLEKAKREQLRLLGDLQVESLLEEKLELRDLTMNLEILGIERERLEKLRSVLDKYSVPM